MLGCHADLRRFPDQEEDPSLRRDDSKIKAPTLPNRICIWMLRCYLLYLHSEKDTKQGNGIVPLFFYHDSGHTNTGGSATIGTIIGG